MIYIYKQFVNLTDISHVVLFPTVSKVTNKIALVKIIGFVMYNTT